MKDFKVGDRIKYIGTDEDYRGKCGTIIVIDNNVNTLPYGVKFDERIIIGHDLNEQCEDGYGLWLGANEMGLVYPTLEDYTDQELKDELKRRKDKERIDIIAELRKYIDKPKPVYLHDIPEYTCEFGLTLDDEEFKCYCERQTTVALKRELKNRKEGKIISTVNILNNNIEALKDLGYTIPYENGTVIDSLEFNKVFDKIGVFYE